MAGSHLRSSTCVPDDCVSTSVERTALARFAAAEGALPARLRRRESAPPSPPGDAPPPGRPPAPQPTRTPGRPSGLRSPSPSPSSVTAPSGAASSSTSSHSVAAAASRLPPREYIAPRGRRQPCWQPARLPPPRPPPEHAGCLRLGAVRQAGAVSRGGRDRAEGGCARSGSLCLCHWQVSFVCARLQHEHLQPG